MVRGSSIFLALSPHLFGIVLLGLRKLLRCRVRYDVLQLWTHSTVSNSLSFSPWHSLSIPAFYTSSLSPGLACHRSSCFPLHHYSASFCFQLSCVSLLAHVSFCPTMNLLHFYHCPPLYLLLLLDEWRCLKGVDDARAEAYVGAPRCVPDHSPQGDTIVWHDGTGIRNPTFKNNIRNIINPH